MIAFSDWYHNWTTYICFYDVSEMPDLTQLNGKVPWQNHPLLTP
jgi:hypothetical protein